jgi:hypothetical protein
MQPRPDHSAAPARRMIFLHHSVGADLIRDGNVRALLKQQAPHVEFWDYAYNPPRLRRRVRSLVDTLRGRPSLIMPDHYYGLRDDAGRHIPMSFNVPNDNTDPDGLAAIVAQPLINPPRNTFSRLMHFDVIALKSCFTILPITSEEQFERYKRHYWSMREAMGRYPEKLFLLLTPPPLRASLTTPEHAALARRLAQWLASKEFAAERENLAVFDLFDALAVPEGQPEANTLRPQFCREAIGDTHPNAAAGQTVAPQWVRFIAQAIGRASDSRQSVAAR